MKYGVFSDVHGDIDNLESLFKKFEEERTAKNICLGDIVHNGKSFKGNRCVSFFRKDNNCYSIKGNHDREVIDNYDRDKFFEENIEYLMKLPRFIQIGDIMFFHDSLNDKFNVEEEFNALKRYNAKIGFFGHGHKQIAYRMKHNIEELKNIKLYFKDGLYLINPGSLWKDKRYGIYNFHENSFEFKQLS